MVDELNVAAYHEAGHAVAAYVLGRGVREVSVCATDGSGHVRLHNRRRTWLNRLEEADYASGYGGFIDGRLRRQVEIDVMIAIAGGEAAMAGLDLEEHEVGMGLIMLSPSDRLVLANQLAGTSELGNAEWVDIVLNGGDMGYVYELVHKVSGGDDEGSAYFEWLQQRTRNLLRHPVSWAAVEALAEQLLVEPDMSGHRANEVIEKAMETRRAWHRRHRPGQF